MCAVAVSTIANMGEVIHVPVWSKTVKHVPSVVVQHPITHYIWSQCCTVAQADAALSRLKLNQYIYCI